MNKATIRLYKISGLFAAAAAIVVVILGKVSILSNEMTVPTMLILLGVAAFCCANTQEETGSRVFSRFCTACGIILVICAVTIIAINILTPIITKT